MERHEDGGPIRLSSSRIFQGHPPVPSVRAFHLVPSPSRGHPSRSSVSGTSFKSSQWNIRDYSFQVSWQVKIMLFKEQTCRTTTKPVLTHNYGNSIYNSIYPTVYCQPESMHLSATRSPHAPHTPSQPPTHLGDIPLGLPSGGHPSN